MTSTNDSLDKILQAIADPTRRRILHALRERGVRSIPRTMEGAMTGSVGKCSGLCAGDVEAKVRLSQPTISHHMAILTEAGLVDAVKQGQWRWYRRNEPAIKKLLKVLKTKL